MAQKTVTSWKNKKVFQIVAPENFDSQEIGETVASDTSLLAGRTINVSLGELTNDRSKNYMNIIFEVFEVNGNKVQTRFKRFFIPTGFLRSKVRKRTTKIDFQRQFNIDDKKVKAKIMALSRYKVSEVQRAQIKAGIRGVIDEHMRLGLEKFVQEALFGKLGTDIYKRIKSTCPILRVEVYSIEVLR